MASRLISEAQRPPASTRPRKRTYVKVAAKPTMQELLKSLRGPPRFAYSSQFDSTEFEALMQARWRRYDEEGPGC